MDALKTNSNLTSLNLAHNNIPDTDIIILLELINNNPRLKKIDLTGNKITENGIKILQEACADRLPKIVIEIAGKNVMAHSSEELKTQDGNPKLDKDKVTTNLDLGREAIHYAKKYIKGSATMEFFITPMRARTLSTIESLTDLYCVPNRSDFRAMKRHVKGSKLFSAGKCGEYSFLILNYLRKNNIDAEYFSIKNGDHAFIVMGREPNSDPNDPSTWGKNAVVCDGLSGECYRALDENLKSKMQCWVRSQTQPPPLPEFITMTSISDKADMKM
ncbi:hypothetical protein [Legionella brunensis]|uniref:Uncharacterized protein n=1 Tax=Legionella brunensis TaxID=29422 RepID=A0A0W0SSR0_9GAMM|nr:hypothetical protein [Legionella brunensis]KTC86439.1 hypothetical protein Lbru_0380 [Legionella brunensis]